MSAAASESEEVRVIEKSGYGQWPTIDLDPSDVVLRTDLHVDGAQQYLRLVVRRVPDIGGEADG